MCFINIKCERVSPPFGKSMGKVRPLRLAGEMKIIETLFSFFFFLNNLLASLLLTNFYSKR